MKLGIAAHVYFLEGLDEFHSQYVVCDSAMDKRTKIYKSMQEGAREKGKTLISSEELDKIKGMYDSFSLHPAYALLKNGEKEAVALWEHTATGVECKAKIDILGEDYIADLKFTGKEIDPTNDYGLLQLIYERGYHRQLSFYKEPFDEVKHLYLIYIETEAPYEITWVDLMDDPDWLKLGRMEIDIAMAKYIDYINWSSGSTSVNPGYSTSRRKITCPKWAMDRVEKLKWQLF